MFTKNPNRLDENDSQRIDRELRSGYSPVEALERCGLLKVSDERSHIPWEIDEFSDL